MNLVSLSIWLALAAWTLVILGRLRGREIRGARLIWMAGWSAYFLHVFAAFDHHYRWSHAVALQETARQTRELTGWETEIGLWLNYLFGLLWLVDALRWLATGEPAPRGCWRFPFLAIHWFLAFMVFNGTVVFGQGAARGFGICLFLLLTVSFFLARIRRSES